MGRPGNGLRTVVVSKLSLTDGAVYLAAVALVGLLLLRWAASPSGQGQEPPAEDWWKEPPGDKYPLLDWLDGVPGDLEACPLVTADTDHDDVADSKFSVHILDANSVLEHIPELRGKQEARCNLSSPEVWPHSQFGRGMDASNTTQHWAYQHGVQWWITQALHNSTLVRIVNSTEEADLIFVDLHCFTLWAISYDHPFGNRNQTNPSVYLEQIVSHISRSRRFKRKYGADFIFVQSHPAMVGEWAAVFSGGRMCGALRNAYWMLPERHSMCHSDQAGLLHNRAVIVPYLAVTDLQLKPIRRGDRPIFFFFRGACAPHWKDLRRQYSTGKLMRTAVVKGIQALPAKKTGLGSRTRVTCSCDICGEALSHKETMKRLASSIFCPVLPGDTQSSRRVSEVILSGCIPVFFGPPYHTMPLADVVDYRSFSVFLRFKDISAWVLRGRRQEGDGWNDESVLGAWQPDTNMTGARLVHSMEEAYWYLHSIPEAEIDRMQAALTRERYKLLYSPPPGAKTSQLGELLVQKLCQRVRAVRRLDRSGEVDGRQRWRQRPLARAGGVVGVATQHQQE